jgi:hypothetical protein
MINDNGTVNGDEQNEAQLTHFCEYSSKIILTHQRIIL